MPELSTNGWNEWAHRVLGDIERLESKQDQLIADISALRVDIAILKTKAMLIGGVYGTAAAIVISVVSALITRGP